MNCNFCGQEYEFSLGHRCRVMQEESKQPMTQPDLVSKLRELTKRIEKFADQRDRESNPCSAQDIRACALLLRESLREFLPGREGQPAVRLLPAQPRPDIAPDLPSQPETDFGTAEEVIAGLDGIIAHNSDVALAHSAFAAPSTPIVSSKWCAKYGGLYDGDYCRLCDCELKQPSPSTPIVPGTAGLSADFFQQHETTYTQKPSGRYEWKCSCGNSAEDFASWTDCHRFTRKHWSEAINALLGAAKPAGISIDALEDLMRQFKQREARIRKDVLEEYKKSLDVPELEDFAKGAVIEAQHQRQRWGDEHDTSKEPEEWFWLVGYLAGKGLQAQRAGDMEKFKHHLITGAAVLANWHARALAERPAPAGEVKGEK